MTSNEPPLLTRVGRARLEERARRLEEETIPALVEAIEEEDDEMAPRLELDLAQRELEQLKYVLETAGSVYVIADTLIGPFFVGYGRSGSNNSSAYLYLNRSF